MWTQSLTARGEVGFKPLTLIYGPNGQGKTTLVGECAVGLRG